MTHLLKRHPLPVTAFLRRSVVLTYAATREVLVPLLSPGLELDLHGDLGFLAVAMVQTERLRPSMFPEALGLSFFLAGYRLFVRYKARAGKNLRGLRILRSETDSRALVAVGNLTTHYNYRLVSPQIDLRGADLVMKVSCGGRPNLDLTAHLDRHELPENSVFTDAKDARRFAGPMPFTFDYERETHSIIRVEGVRKEWDPQLVEVDVRKAPNFREFGIEGEQPTLVSAFAIHNVPYRWKPGIVERIA